MYTNNDKILFKDDCTDKDFEEIIIPGDWLDIIKQNDDLASLLWLRKDFFIDEDHRDKTLLVYLGEIGIADETYLNGVRIGSTGRIPLQKGKLDYRQACRYPRVYPVPKDIIRFGEKNTIAVRIYSHVFNGIKGEPALIEDRHGFPNQFFTYYSSLIINVSALVLNLVFFTFFLALSVANYKQLEYIYFCFILFLGILLNLPFVNFPLLINGLVKFKVLLLVYVFINYFIFIAIQEILNKRYPVMSFIMSIILLIITALIIVSPDSAFLIFYCGFTSVVFVNILLLLTLYIFAMQLKTDPMRYWYLIFILGIIPFSFWRNSYYLGTMQFNEMGDSIFIHIPLLLYAVMLFFFYDFEYKKRERDSLYQALLEKSRSMQNSLNRIKKRELKQEPRETIHVVIDHLDSNYQERYNRKQLAQMFGLNEDYMMQLFKKTTGVTISQYINNKRLEIVKELLVDTEIKIIDIAYHVGFDNYTHFHRLFKKNTGLTPKEYRDYTRSARLV